MCTYIGISPVSFIAINTVITVILTATFTVTVPVTSSSGPFIFILIGIRRFGITGTAAVATVAAVDVCKYICIGACMYLCVCMYV